MKEKRAFLLTRASSFTLEDGQESYDEQLQMNVVLRSGRTHPLVAEDGFARTESKTMRAPGDDDPDEDDEGCY